MKKKPKNGKLLHEFVEGLKRAHGNRLVSVFLYGSQAAADDAEEFFGQNLLVVLREITPEDLKAAQAPMKAWAKAGNPLPVYFTEEEITDAADVFPIEYRDMSEVHKVLHGPDLLAELQISEANLRHQLEYELRGKFIRLRGLFVANCHSGKKLTALMTDSLDTFAVLFRHVLHVVGEVPSAGKRAIVSQTVVRLGLKSEPFDKIMEARNENWAFGSVEGEKVFDCYLKELEKVIEAVDELGARPVRA